MSKCGNEIADQIVSEGPCGLNALLLQGDRRGFGLADPDRQIAVAVRFPQQQNSLVLRLLNTNADHANLAHLCLPSVLVPPVPEFSPMRSRTSRTADLINEVCNVMASAATSRARSSARSRAPALPAFTTGPAICAMRSGLAVGRGPEGAQVPWLHAVVPEGPCALGDHHGMLVVRDRRDQW